MQRSDLNRSPSMWRLLEDLSIFEPAFHLPFFVRRASESLKIFDGTFRMCTSRNTSNHAGLEISSDTKTKRVSWSKGSTDTRTPLIVLTYLVRAFGET